MDDIQKAIETLKEMKLFYNPFNKNGEIDTAISAMQELQAYRATGLTPRMIRDLKENNKHSHHLAVQRTTELDEYQEIGTPEECREARERQQARKPLMSKNTNKLTGNIFICPSCNGIVGIDDEREFYCAGCGQAIDWGMKDE